MNLMRGCHAGRMDPTRTACHSPKVWRIENAGTMNLTRGLHVTRVYLTRPASQSKQRHRLLNSSLSQLTSSMSFLDPDKSCLMILNVDLNPDRTATLLEKLKAHISAIGCSVKDLKDMRWIFLLQVFENTTLHSDLPPDRIARLLEDFQTQRTMIRSLIEKLMSTNPAIWMHMTLPADDHRHTDHADQHTGHAQPT